MICGQFRVIMECGGGSDGEAPILNNGRTRHMGRGSLWL